LSATHFALAMVEKYKLTGKQALRTGPLNSSGPDPRVG
jgi:hypothetical protein